MLITLAPVFLLHILLQFVSKLIFHRIIDKISVSYSLTVAFVLRYIPFINLQMLVCAFAYFGLAFDIVAGIPHNASKFY